MQPLTRPVNHATTLHRQTRPNIRRRTNLFMPKSQITSFLPPLPVLLPHFTFTAPLSEFRLERGTYSESGPA
jgi:hypothetical protein